MYIYFMQYGPMAIPPTAAHDKAYPWSRMAEVHTVIAIGSASSKHIMRVTPVALAQRSRISPPSNKRCRPHEIKNAAMQHPM